MAQAAKGRLRLFLNQKAEHGALRGSSVARSAQKTTLTLYVKN